MKQPFQILTLTMALMGLTMACKQVASPATTTEKQGVFSATEWSMMQSADSVKLFRLREINRYTPMAMPAEMTEHIEFVFKEGEMVREFYYEKSRLMTSEETRELLPFITLQTEAKPVYQYKDKCHYQPGAGIKFYKGKKSFNLLMCFNCNVWAFERNAEMYYVDFDNSQRKELVRYAKKLFPHDREFRAIKE